MKEIDRFRKQLRESLEMILGGITPQPQRTGREDYNSEVYVMPEFRINNEKPPVSVSFIPFSARGSIAQHQQHQINGEYLIRSGNDRIGFIQRLPKKTVIFFTKPYRPLDIFVENAIRDALVSIDNVKIEYNIAKLSEINRW